MLPAEDKEIGSNMQGEPSDHDVDLTTVEGEKRGRTRQEELQIMDQF